MTEPRQGRPGRGEADDSPGHLPEHFLVDGVAPAVIGGGPPESPFDVQPDPEPEPADRRPRYVERREPPTSPIPVIHPLGPEQPKRRSWLARMFRG